METAEIERELRQFFHSVRRNSGPPNPHIEFPEKPSIELLKYLPIFQNLVELSRDRYAGLMPAVILTGDVIPANFGDREIATKYLSRVIDVLENKLQISFDRILKALDHEATHDGDAVIPTILPLPSAVDIFSARLADAFKRSAMVAGGVPVTVHSISSGYVLRCTPRWLFSIGAFGSHPTTPVTGYLEPADYRFAGDKHGSLTWDRAIHTVTGPSTATNTSMF